MIKLFSNHCMVVDAQGKAETYDFDALRNVLQVCFERHSVREFWLTEHVSLVVEEQMLQRRAEGAELPPESLIDEQVALVLRASGYAEVAADYERERGLAPPEIPSIELLPWNRKRLEKRLGADLPLSSAQVQALAREVGTAIEKLGMKNVGDELIRQVAIHVLQLGTDHSGPVSTRKNDWLFGVADLRPLFDSAGSRLAQLSICRALPVSRAVPRARLEFNHMAFAERLGDGPLMEITVLTELQRCLPTVRDMLGAMRDAICTTLDHAHYHPAHLVLRDARRMVETQFPNLSRRNTRRFVEETTALFQKQVADCAPYELIVSVRNS